MDSISGSGPTRITAEETGATMDAETRLAFEKLSTPHQLSLLKAIEDDRGTFWVMRRVPGTTELRASADGTLRLIGTRSATTSEIAFAPNGPTIIIREGEL